MQYGFFFDALRCVGCEACVDACCVQCGLERAVVGRRVIPCNGGIWSEAEDGSCSTFMFTYYLSLSCHQCSVPPCVQACPSGAFAKSPETGSVSIDGDLCTGCGICAQVCPYEAPHVDEECGRAFVCDACVSLISQGAEPACVTACPEGALACDDIERLRAAHGVLASIPPLPPAELTHPNLVLNVPPVLVETFTH